jgi:hypothetical protein
MEEEQEYRHSVAWVSLGEELRARDCHGDFTVPLSWPGMEDHPVNHIVNAGIHSAPYAGILIRYLDSAMDDGEMNMVVRSLTQKGITGATDRLLRFFGDEAKDHDLYLLWAVGNALHTMAPRDHLQEIIAICRNRALGFSRGQLIIHLSRFKKTEEVFQTLLSLLDDESIRGQVLEALWRYGDVRAIAAIEATPTREGFYEVKAKNTALRRLNRKSSKSSRDNRQL